MQKLFLLFLAVAAEVVSSAVPSKVIRPCHLRDYTCIRDNLAANSRCSPRVRGSVPGQYMIPRFEFETPFFNASYIDNNLNVINHDKCFVSEFFYNVANDKAVLALDCPLLTFQSDRTLIQHLSLAEDTTYSYKINAEYPLIRLTTNLPRADEMNLCNTFTYAEVTALPIFKINPNDLPTQNFLSTDLSYLDIYERETFLYRAKQLFRFFVNSAICDFGCNA